MTATVALEAYPDGRWTVADHAPASGGPLWCRGNIGEVFPNVITPLSSSLYLRSIAVGQAQASLDFGAVTGRQFATFRDDEAWSTGVFGGYLYANVSLARTAAARAPGLTVEMLDDQMFGLTGAPPHRRGRGERNVPAASRTLAFMARALRRPDNGQLAADRAYVADFVARQPDVASATVDQLFAITTAFQPLTSRMMHSLLMASFVAGLGRIALERVLGRLANPELLNRLAAGLGTIESAEPAEALWDLGRSVAAEPALSAAFDAGAEGVVARLRADASHTEPVRGFLAGFDAFVAAHGARGPNEWELASPTWGTDPALGLVVVDRLRHVPAERDPRRMGATLTAQRRALMAEVRAELPRRKRGLFDRALRATFSGATQREATKAAFVRGLYPARLALAELARRSGLGHDDFFLLQVDEARQLFAARPAGGPTDLAELIAERRARRDYLQARVPPFWYDGALPDPATWPLRAAAAPAAAVAPGRETTAPDSASVRRLSGMGVCPGRATGTARVVTDPAQPGDLGPGDILVAPITDPAWTPLFLAAAGVVVDVGAQLSHAAIVARELGIPAVVSVTGASTTIPDSAQVTVDGSTGEVIVHE